MAAPTIVAASPDAAWDDTGNPTPALPTGTADGDLLLLAIMARYGDRIINLTDGYALVSGDNVTGGGSGLTAEIQAKVAGPSETAPLPTSDLDSTHPTGAPLVAVRGSSGVADLVISAASITSSTNLIAQAVTTPVDECLVLRVYCIADDNAVVTPPAGHSLVFSDTTTLGSHAALYVYSSEQATAGDTGSATLEVGASDPYIAWTVAVQPGASSPPSNAGKLTVAAALNKAAGTKGYTEAGAANVLAGTSGLTLAGALNAHAGTSGLSEAAAANAAAGTDNLTLAGACNVLAEGA